MFEQFLSKSIIAGICLSEILIIFSLVCMTSHGFFLPSTEMLPKLLAIKLLRVLVLLLLVLLVLVVLVVLVVLAIGGVVGGVRLTTSGVILAFACWVREYLVCLVHFFKVFFFACSHIRVIFFGKLSELLFDGLTCCSL